MISAKLPCFSPPRFVIGWFWWNTIGSSFRPSPSPRAISQSSGHTAHMLSARKATIRPKHIKFKSMPTDWFDEKSLKISPGSWKIVHCVSLHFWQSRFCERAAQWLLFGLTPYHESMGLTYDWWIMMSMTKWWWELANLKCLYLLVPWYVWDKFYSILIS